MASCHVAALVSFAALIAFAGTPSHADSPPQPPRSGPAVVIPNLVIPTDLQPDLIIASAKATTSCVANTVTVTMLAVVTNQSQKGPADLSKVPWQIIVAITKWSAIHGNGKLEPATTKVVLPQSGQPKLLVPGQSWTATMQMTGIPRYKTGFNLAKQYVFTVVADPLKAVTESNEQNNEKLAYANDPC